MKNSEFLRRKQISILNDINEINTMLEHREQLHIPNNELRELLTERFGLINQKRETTYAIRRTRRTESGTDRICACGTGHLSNDQCTH